MSDISLFEPFRRLARTAHVAHNVDALFKDFFTPMSLDFAAPGPLPADDVMAHFSPLALTSSRSPEHLGLAAVGKASAEPG